MKRAFRDAFATLWVNVALVWSYVNDLIASLDLVRCPEIKIMPESRGTLIFVGTQAGWLLVPIASVAGWSTAQIASLSGGVFIATKVGLVTAIAVLGKSGFNHLERLLFGFLRKLGPPQQVGRHRYYIGLILFLVPVLMTWAEPYVAILGPGSMYLFLQDLPLELLLLVGLFLLGGEFWDKVRGLFRQGAKVEIVAETSAAPA